MISVRLGFFLKTGQAALGMARALWPCFVAALLALKSTTSTSSAPWDLCSPLQHPLHLKQECKAQGASGHKEFHVSCRKEIIYRTLQVTAPSTTNWTWLCWSVQLPQKSHSAMGRMETRNRICVSSCYQRVLASPLGSAIFTQLFQVPAATGFELWDAQKLLLLLCSSSSPIMDLPPVRRSNLQ